MIVRFEKNRGWSSLSTTWQSMIMPKEKTCPPIRHGARFCAAQALGS
jgi:hypothetical protein